MRERLLNYNTAIREAIEQSIKKNKKIILMGLGVDDPKGVFGTTLNLHKTFKNNVFDLPTAENAFTGIGLGLSISGFKPILVHQVDFHYYCRTNNKSNIKMVFMVCKVNVPMVIN